MCASVSLAPSPRHTNIVPGVSSTKQSPAESELAFSATWTARVSSSSKPRTWKSETPSVSYESLSALFLKPLALPPEWMTILPRKSRMKWVGSLPITTRTCVAAPPSMSSILVVCSAAAPFSSCDDWAPSQK